MPSLKLSANLFWLVQSVFGISQEDKKLTILSSDLFTELSDIILDLWLSDH